MLQQIDQQQNSSSSSSSVFSCIHGCGVYSHEILLLRQCSSNLCEQSLVTQQKNERITKKMPYICVCCIDNALRIHLAKRAIGIGNSNHQQNNTGIPA